MEKNHFVSVAGIVMNEKDEVLLVNSPWRGWEFPGGMVEPGESLQTALKREIFEESGVNVEITGFIGICKNIGKDIVNVDFACTYINGTLTTSSESTEVQWFSKEDAVNAVTNELTRIRLNNMLSGSSEMHCFSFSKDPFLITDDETYRVGL